MIVTNTTNYDGSMIYFVISVIYDLKNIIEPFGYHFKVG